MIDIKVLFAVSECTPFAQTGGLADIAGSLPKALSRVGCNIRVVLPKYKTIPKHFTDQFKKETDFNITLNHNQEKILLESFKYQNVMYYFINHHYFLRDNIYGYGDEGARFALFSKAVLEMIRHIRFKPNILHLNDWHVGMVPLFLKEQYAHKKYFHEMKTIQTIHNIEYQGSFDRMILDYCMIDQEQFHFTDHENLVNFLKTGINLAHQVTTVSPTYAKEIKTPEFSEGLDYILNKNIEGIINGIDTNAFNPRKDKLIKKNYDKYHIGPKKKNKTFLQTYFSLPSKDVPLVVMIGRLVKQKGLDIVMKAFSEIMQTGCQFILLGCGEPYYEQFFQEMSKMYPNQCKVSIEFNQTLARFMYAGGDFLLMPSRFEPCGLAQLMAMRYGTIPIVRQTGGLKDTVEIFNDLSKEGCGFGFQSYHEKDLINVMKYAFELYEDKKLFKTLIQNAMNKDFSWKNSAESYKSLYQSLIEI